jgi:tetratricopeptide (TPR) repeat protein
MKAGMLVLVGLGLPLLVLLALSKPPSSPQRTAPPSQPAVSPNPVASPRPVAVGVPPPARPQRPRITLPLPSPPADIRQVLRLADDVLQDVIHWAQSAPPTAGQYLARGDFNRALTEFDRGLVAKPNDPQLLLGKGMALVALGRSEDALPLFEAAVRHDPEDASARFNYAVTLARVNLPDQAITALRELLQCEPSHLRGRFNLATLLQARQQYRDALVLWRELTEAPPPAAPAEPGSEQLLHVHLLQAWSHRGECAMALARTQEAQESFRQVVALEPGDARGWANAGIAQAAGGNRREAIASLERALELDPKLIPAINQLAYLRAMRYRDIGEDDDKVKVMDLCRRSLALAPEQGNMRSLRYALEHEGEEEPLIELEASEEVSGKDDSELPMPSGPDFASEEPGSRFQSTDDTDAHR